MPAVAVRARKHTVHNTALAVDVRKVYGYSAYCACGWEGELRRKHGEAQWDARVHRHEGCGS